MCKIVTQHEFIIDTDLRRVSADERSATSTSTSTTDDSSSFESIYELDISRLLTFERKEYSDSVNRREHFDCDCSEITEQEYSMDESFCDVEELDLIQPRITEETKRLNLETAPRKHQWKRSLQVVGVCVGIPTLLLLLDPSTGKSTRH